MISVFKIGSRDNRRLLFYSFSGNIGFGLKECDEKRKREIGDFNEV